MTAARFVLFVGEACRPGVEDRAALARDGLRCLWTGDVPQAQRAARLARFDAAVVDAEVLGSPFGLALARLRDTLSCPMMVIGGAALGAGEDVDEIIALELGAEAFLRRPVAPRRLRAHLAALLRRRTEPEPPAWQAGLPLTSVQAALLNCLMAAQGRIVQRDELMAALPGGRSLRARTVDAHMHRLRRRLAATGSASLCIDAVHGRGYMLRTSPAAQALPERAAA